MAEKPSMSSAAASLSTDTLLNLLECPVCLEPCIPPIYACSIGHKICKGCAPNIHRCPVCRSGYMGTRDFVAEELYSKLAEAGLLPGVEEQSDDTEKPIECHLGTLSETLKMQCSLGALNTLPTFECYVAHLVHRHKVGRETLHLDVPFRKRFYYRNLSFVRNGASKLLVLGCCDHSFLLTLNKSDDNQNIWIYLSAASCKIAKEFVVDLEIPLAHDDDALLAANIGKDIHTIKEKPENIYKNQKCLIVKESMLNELGCHRIAKTGRCWELNITIRKNNAAEKKTPTATVRTSPHRSAALIAELPHYNDNGDGDDLGDQIVGLQNQVRDFRIGLMNRIQSAGRAEGATARRNDHGTWSLLSTSARPAIPVASAPAGDGSIRNRAMLYRSPGTSNLSADSTEPEQRNANALSPRERSLGRLREHRDLVMELRRLSEQREALERREREERSSNASNPPPARPDRRTLRRLPANSVITARDFFTDSDEENEYIESLAREHASGGLSEASPTATSPTHSLRNPRRSFSARIARSPDSADADPIRLRYCDLLAQRRRATSPESPARFRGDGSAASDSSCTIC